MDLINRKLAKEYWRKKTGRIRHYSEGFAARVLHEQAFVGNAELAYFNKVTGGSSVAEFTILMALYNMLLQRYFGDSHIISSEIELCPGKLWCFELPAISGNTVKEYIQEAKKEIQEVYRYAGEYELPENQLQRVKHILYRFHYGDMHEPLCTGLLLNIKKTGNGEWLISLNYAEHFIQPSVAAGFLLNYCNWLKQLDTHIHSGIQHLPLVTQQERELLLHTFNANALEYPSNKTITSRFEEQVVKIPDNTALVFEHRELSYRELNERVNRLANYMIENCGLCAEQFAGIKLPRNEQMLVALLAVLKTGAAYVPIDTSYPPERIAYIEQDSGCKLLIDEALYQQFEKNSRNCSAENPQVNTTASDISYIIYTSGTTGNPKGVMITNRNVSAFIHWAQQEFAATPFEMVYAATSYCFDLSVFEMFYPLSAGKKIRILNNALEIGQWLPVDSLVMLNTVPSGMRNILDSGYSLEKVSAINLAGEPFPIDMANRLAETNAEIRNLYGPSEDTTYSTCYLLPKENQHTSVPIGKPIANTQAYILDKEWQLVPVGVMGKLYLSGDGVAAGYLNRPELTAEKFIENPFLEGKRMYDTGDLARWLPDGNIEFLGRKDQQVKIRGYRIELGEIEHAIVQYSETVKQVAVEAKEIKGDKVLVAYYVSVTPLDKEGLRNYLQEKLPAYMVPGYYVSMNSLPLSPNGKIDRKQLPGIGGEDIIRREYVAPGNELETQLVAIWQEVLGVDRIGVTDDFFELGGHSLMLTKLSGEYQKHFKVAISLKSLFVDARLKNHAKLVSESTTPVYDIASVGVQEHYALSPSQNRFWLLYRIRGRSKAFNIYSTLKLPENLDREKFRMAFNRVVERHEALRSIFVEEAGVPRLKVLPQQTVVIPQFSSAAQAREEVFEHEFELETYPLFKLALLEEGQDHTLYFNIHHSICDGWSLDVIVHDLMEIYHAAVAGKTADLPGLSIQYKDYAQWQNSLLSGGATKQRDYWQQQLSGSLPYLQLPADYAARPRQNNDTSSFFTTYITAAQKRKMEQVAAAHGASEFALFIATLKILLHRLTSEEDIIIGIPSANRDHYQLRHLVGCFINTLMLRNKINGDYTFSNWLNRVNETLINALVHQNYPFEYLLEGLQVKQHDDRFPISPVFLNMLDFEAKETETITDFSPQHGTMEAAPKFDVECYIKSYTNGYRLHCVYDHHLYKKETIQYWMEAYCAVISQAIQDVEQPLHEIKIFDTFLLEEEDKKPSNQFDHFAAEEIHQPIARRFEQQAEKYPGRTAVFCNGTSLTYTELNQCANHLAVQIMEKASRNTQRVALLLDHNETCVTGMLGVLKAGYAYVPIDAGNPLSRMQFILEDSGCSILVCNDATINSAKQLQQAMPQLVLIHIPSHYATQPIVGNPAIAIHNDAEAYVLYTSGSTGMPKGVIQLQKNVLHYIRVYTNNVHIAATDNLSVFSTYTFDASVKDIYGAILNGATVSFYDMAQNGPDRLPQWLHTQQVTIIHMVPTIYRHFLKSLNDGGQLDSIRLVDLGGEPCHKSDFDLFKQYFRKGAFLVNDYGPTESTIVSQKFLTHSSSITRNNIPLGTAVTETGIFLLDEHNNPKGVYQSGEIVFKSKYLSPGYLNREELNKKVFVTDPVTGQGRVYRSGDIGRMLCTGEIEFLHRKDSQVKLNGLRIELSEIEFQLEQIDGIKEAVVLLKELQGNHYITAYLLFTQPLATSEIKAMLQKVLPKYMIPSIYMNMEKLPLTRTGKIDRNGLPSPTPADLKTVPYVPPQNEVQEKLVSFWAEVLKRDAATIGIEDNFFESGGNSLQAVVIINKINTTYNTRFSIANLYETLNINGLSALLNFSLQQTRETGALHQEQDEFIL